jgi:uncharacterized protein YbjT (DUF2867 family)
VTGRRGTYVLNTTGNVLYISWDMNVLILGATGMVGQGALRECLADPEVTRVLTVGRTLCGQRHPKLREIVHADLLDYSAIERDLVGFDACFFCLGKSSAGLSEDEYRHVTYDITLAAGQAFVRLSPQMTFIYVSGAGTDSTEAGGSMWARVKGQTENALLALPFKAAYMLRPAVIQPMHGIKSKTASYRILYSVTSILLPALRALFPNYVTTTEQLGRVMISLVKRGYEKPILETRDINEVSAALAR